MVRRRAETEDLLRECRAGVEVKCGYEQEEADLFAAEGWSTNGLSIGRDGG